MSFKDLTAAIAVQEKEIVLAVNDQQLVFKAVQKPYLELQAIAITAAKEEKNYFALLLVAGIKDADGKHMTYDQALSLPKKYAQPMIEAVVEVNGLSDGDTSEKN